KTGVRLFLPFSAICVSATTGPPACSSKWSKPVWYRPCSPMAIAISSFPQETHLVRIKYFSAAVALSLAPVFAWAADAPAQLQQFVSTVQSATGQFTQQTETAGQGRAKAPQQGDFSFQRPGKFKWHVKQPYEQLVVSDGTRVLQYDPDLAQVTERSIDQSIGTSPAAILFGSGSLDEAFEVTARPDADQLQWLRAVPRSSDAGFK